MRLYVNCPECKQRIYFNSAAKSRSELPLQFYLSCTSISCSKKRVYSPHEVFAEPNLTVTAGAVLGGLVGLLGGPVGIVVGTLIGSGLGKTSENTEKEAVDRFNRGEN